MTHFVRQNGVEEANKYRCRAHKLSAHILNIFRSMRGYPDIIFLSIYRSLILTFSTMQVFVEC